MHRRDFLSGPRSTGTAAPSSGEVVTLSAPAMACEFRIQFPSNQPDRKHAIAAFDLIADLEAQLSVYRDDSEISRINRTAASAPVRVEPLLFHLLERCCELHEATDGAFDVAAGPLVRAWGFLRREGRIPGEEELAEARARSGMSHVHCDARGRTVSFDREGVELNLGAVGKGYALDRVAQRLKSVGYNEALLGAGASSILAVGRPYWDEAWHVDLRHPLDRERPIAMIRLVDEGLSTSGAYEQAFTVDGRRYGHLIDPRSGSPASGVLQATAVAGDAAWAEALSTAFYVNGVDWAEDYCRRNDGIGALLIPEPQSGSGAGLQMIALGAVRERLVLPEGG